jgi:hypothetical protein
MLKTSSKSPPHSHFEEVSETLALPHFMQTKDGFSLKKHTSNPNGIVKKIATGILSYISFGGTKKLPVSIMLNSPLIKSIIKNQIIIMKTESIIRFRFRRRFASANSIGVSLTHMIVKVITDLFHNGKPKEYCH